MSLVDAATRGDHDAFRALVEPLSRELHVHCYRMLGSFHDAEDVHQDALIKAWRRIETYDHRASFRAWMYKITTNASLDALRRRRRRVLPQDIAAPNDPTLPVGDARLDILWLEPYPDALLTSSNPEAALEQTESIRLAFVRALQLLPARQRAVLILRDVLEWPAADVAVMLETTVSAVNSALQRARATTARHHPDSAVDAAPLDERRTGLLSRFVTAWQQGDIDAIVALLTEDAVQCMPPMPAWYAGREAIRVFTHTNAYGGDPRPGCFRLLPTTANGQPAFAVYRRETSDIPYEALCITVVTFDPTGSRVAEMTSFLNPLLFAHWGFPPTWRD